MLRSRLAFHGTIISDTNAHRPLVRNLSPAFRMQKRIILTQSDLTMQVVKGTVTSAYGEMEIEREEDAKN